MKYKNESGWSMVGMMAGVAIIGALSFGAGMAQADTIQGDEGVGLVKQALGILRGYRASGSENTAKAGQQTNAQENKERRIDKKTCQDMGGTWKRDTCCKDGEEVYWKEVYSFHEDGFIHEDETIGYITSPERCGCPKGVTPKKVNGELVCCQGGFAWNSYRKDYTVMVPKTCGCPKGVPPKEVDGELVCCQGGKAWNSLFEDYTNVSPKECGCPEGVTPKEVEGELVCCQGGLAWNSYSKDYTNISPEECGCPEGVTPKEFNGKLVCCQGVLAWNSYSKDYINVSPEECGCSQNVEPKEVDGRLFCCKDGKVMDTNGRYTEFRDECGCSQGIQPKEVNGKLVCCKDGKWMDEKGKYTMMAPDLCGCPPDGHEPEDHSGLLLCCQNGKEVNPDTGKYDIDNPRCCPEEAPYAPKSKICCHGRVCGEGVCAEGANCCPEDRQNGAVCINGHWELCGPGYQLCCPGEGSPVWYCDEGIRKCQNGKPYPNCCPEPQKFATRSGTCCKDAICEGICVPGAKCCNGEEQKGAVCINGKWQPCGPGHQLCCPSTKPAGPYECENGKWICIGSEAGGKCTGYGDADGHFES